MPLYLPDNVKNCLPTDESQINASLLMTKYAIVKSPTEKEDSAKFVDRVCLGRMTSPGFSYSEIPGARIACMRLQGRMMVNQSGGVVENANLCLHPFFGFPYIPGSAVKGCVRHYLWTLWDDAQDDTQKMEFARDIVEIFGYSTGDPALDQWCQKNLPELVVDHKTGKQVARAGGVVFFAAQPMDKSHLEADVLTSHHPNYYTGSKDRATDDEAPVPIFFPAVKSGCVFEFTVKSRSDDTCELAGKALEYLKCAMAIEGAGAKTAAGYGWFEFDEPHTRIVVARPIERKRRQDEKNSASQLKETQAREAEEKQKRAAALAQMTPEQAADFSVSEWSDGKRGATLRNVVELQKMLDAEKDAVMRALAGPQIERWRTLLETEKSGKKKEKKAAVLVVQEVYALAKKHSPLIKMPR